MTSKPAEESKVLYPWGSAVAVVKGSPFQGAYCPTLARAAVKHQCGALGGMGSKGLNDGTLILL